MNSQIAMGIAFFGAFLGAVSQLLLKQAANRHYKGLRMYANPYVMSAYFIFFAITFANVFALRYIPLFLLSLIEASGYIYVAVFSAFVLKERIRKKQGIGLLLILAGILIASL
ncbi:MAG: EamA family transporter [Eubacteriales bacterium]|nr:EamA family transporter [Eubacteriales bacterium]